MDKSDLLGIRLVPFNARLRRARRDANLTQKQLGDLAGISQTGYSAIERLCFPVNEETATEIALVLGYDINYLFPPETRNFKSVKTRSIEFVLERHSLADAQHLYLPSAEDEFICNEIQEKLPAILDDILNDLPYRLEQIIRLRFGLNGHEPMTFEEIGKELGVTRERIRDLEARALKSLRHPARSKKLRRYLQK